MSKSTATTLDDLLRHPRMWRAGEPAAHRGRAGPAAVSTGYGALDALLPGGGWPAGALTEILCAHRGIGELRLLAPALALAGARSSARARHVVFVAPPCLPHAPALARHGIDVGRVLLVRGVDAGDALWAVEQALRSSACGAVLAWVATVADRALRRLQLAAEVGGGLGVLFRSPEAAAHRSPAALRLALAPAGEALRVRVLKCRGSAAGSAVTVDLAAP